MNIHKATAAESVPTARWVQVRDTSGRVHLEMRWGIPAVQQVPMLSRAA
ncbi:hypothetical protein GTQ99_09020 [Kineococcus sp. T13]|nr:hypothetical protein [Kineococcus vitellinus]NAZ75560.1 hypothetical protein [Kineococcus vitellinus]